MHFKVSLPVSNLQRALKLVVSELAQEFENVAGDDEEVAVVGGSVVEMSWHREC